MICTESEALKKMCPILLQKNGTQSPYQSFCVGSKCMGWCQFEKAVKMENHSGSYQKLAEIKGEYRQLIVEGPSSIHYVRLEATGYCSYLTHGIIKK